MKRLWSVVLAVMVMAVTSVTAYAVTATEIDNQYKNVLKNFAEVIDGNTVFKPFTFLDTPLSQECKTYLEKCFTNRSRLLVTMNYTYGNLNNAKLNFYFIPEDVTLTKEVANTSNMNSLKYTFSKPITYVSIMGKSSQLGEWGMPSSTSTATDFKISYANTGVEHTASTSITKLFPIGYFTHASEFVIDARYLMTDFEGALGFRIDDTIYEPDKPTPPVEPSQPEIGYPDFPKVEGEYIPYDTTVWNSFAFTVRDTIGKTTNIGFLILGLLTALGVIVLIIKEFTGNSEH